MAEVVFIGSQDGFKLAGGVIKIGQNKVFYFSSKILEKMG